jgi:hypothetical protein
MQSWYGYGSTLKIKGTVDFMFLKYEPSNFLGTPFRAIAFVQFGFGQCGPSFVPEENIQLDIRNHPRCFLPDMAIKFALAL